MSKSTVNTLCKVPRFQNDKMKVTFSSTFSSFLQVCYKAEIFQYKDEWWYNVEIKEIKGWVVKEEVSKPHYLLNYLLGRVMNILEKLCLYM